MQQIIAARIPALPQDHASSDQLLRDTMDQPHTSPGYASVDAMQHSDDTSPIEGGADHLDMGHDGSEDPSGDGRKGYGKRELSTSKRAAQNRAAQRAFRQRKEGYIKKLEEQVRDYQILSENFKAVQQENFQLRDYIINLQSRLLESQGEVPPPPSNLDGLSPSRCAQPVQPPPQSHTATLPRLSELSALTPQHPPSQGQQQADQSQMTAAQAALQGSSILQSPASTSAYKRDD